MATAAKKTTHTLINTGTAGVVYTEDGDSVGGGERVTVEQIDPVGRTALNIGQLLLAPASDD